ncbi:hypothetical protein GGI43DRAFT_430713 [Trichoderma evansii]
MDRDEIDQILRGKRKSTEKACYPCHRRKVRCNHRQPCGTCQKRGHPEICSYCFSATKRRDRRRWPGVDILPQDIPVAEDSVISRQNSSHEAVDNTLPNAVQTLLILGNTLQNIGQSDGAWVLLGTTVRLAQALGLHTEHGGGHSNLDNKYSKTLWAAIVWQDCFLSVCHGRPASVSNVQVQSLYRSNASSSPLSYVEVMCSIAYICFEVTESEPDIERSVRLLQSIDDCSSHAQPYQQTRDSCKNLQEHLEYLALQINMSFTICFLCRPAIKKSTSISHNETHLLLITRAKKGLQNILQSFLDLQALSIIPLRNWSMIHSALTSMLLLSIWEETRNDAKSQSLQKSVLNVLLETSQRDASVDANRSHDDNNRAHWLSTRHVRALMNLLEAIRSASWSTTETSSKTASRRSKEQSGPNGIQIPENIISADPYPISDQMYNTFDQIAPDEVDQFPWVSTDLSPIAYVDEIMNVLFYDTTQV